MKYDRTTLRATALSVKAAHEDALRADHQVRVEKYQQDLVEWSDFKKPETVRALQDALAAVRKDKPIDSYNLRNRCSSPPSKPSELDCCSPATKALDGLVELLDTLADDEITATQLNLAGFKNVSQLLRRPC